MTLEDGSLGKHEAKGLPLMLPYFGSKWRLAAYYPAPLYQHIIEPFAGGAGYSLRYPWHKVTLYDVDPVLCGVWDYLIKASPRDILNLPGTVLHRESLTDVCQEARWLIGFWLGRGRGDPSCKPSPWARVFSDSYIDNAHPNCIIWGERVKRNIIEIVLRIKHWKVFNRSYEDIPACVNGATWFVDPPYQGPSGLSYKYHDVDYSRLSRWCRSLAGQVMVCEMEGADWLPFRPFRDARTTRKKHYREMLWLGGSVPSVYGTTLDEPGTR